MIAIKKNSFITLKNDSSFLGLCKEYENEYVEDMPPVKISNETYINIDKAGKLSIFCAYKENVLVGFLSLIISVLPHYDVNAGIVESFFVSKDYRKTGAGLILLKESENFAKEQGALVFLCSTPIESRLCTILPRKGYTKSDLVFSKRF